MKKLLSVTCRVGEGDDIIIDVSNGTVLDEGLVKTISLNIEYFMVNHVSRKLFKTIDNKIELEIYKIGDLVLAIDEITRSKSSSWLDSVHGTFKTGDFIGKDFNFVMSVESKIINLPVSLILNKLRVFIGLVESEINIKTIKERLILDEKFQDIIFKKSKLHVKNLYLPVKENIYFTESLCIGPKISFYYRDKKLEEERYMANMLINKCKLKIKSELSIELDNLLILELYNVIYSSVSSWEKIDLKINDSRGIKK